jgi:1-acyl-sn-glycerol-3-phosphate acyltransferase
LTENNSLPGSDLLLTGATGFLGKVVLHELLERRESLGVSKIRVLLRTSGSTTADQRFDADIASSPCFDDLGFDWRNLVDPVACELSEPGAGIEPDKREALTKSVTHIINCAASVQFDLPIQQAATANVATALEILDFAQSCPNLVSLVNVSTAYVTPHPKDGREVLEELAPLPHDPNELYEAIMRGEIDATELLAETGHPNTYTLTKCIAEHLLTERKGDTPLTLVRPSIISASMERPRPGWIDSPAAFALFAAQIGSGRMRAVIARPDARIDVIPCDAVADRCIDAAFEPAKVQGSPIVHAVAGYDHSPNIRSCSDTIQSFFTQNPDTRRRSKDMRASVRFLGPDGILFKFNHWLYHVRQYQRRQAEGLSQANRMFAYFTGNTFLFRSSAPFDPPGFSTTTYIETVCKGVAEHLMSADHTAVPVAGRGQPRTKGDLRWALTQKKGNIFIRLAAYTVAKKLRHCSEEVTFDLTSFEDALKQVPEGSPIVLVPSHRSYLDFVLCSLLMFARPDLGIAIPHIAATSDFARIPFISWLILRLHAFYIERGLGREDTKLTEQVRSLITSGRVLEFFIEGRRSRTRQFLAPHRGLLRSLQATGETCTVLPIAFSYDHVPEESDLMVELRGNPRPPMKLKGLLRWNKRVKRGEVDLGRTHITCGRPVDLAPDSDVYGVSREIMAQLQTGTVSTKHHLRTFMREAGTTLQDIDLRWLVEAIGLRGGLVLETKMDDENVPPLIARCMHYQFEHVFYKEAAIAFAGHPAVESHIRLNRYADAGPPSPELELDNPLVIKVLVALFGPVVRNYRATVGALGEPTEPLALTTPAAVLRFLADDDVHLGDVEGAFADMLERNILAYDRDEKTYSWGAEADKFAAYRECLARSL